MNKHISLILFSLLLSVNAVQAQSLFHFATKDITVNLPNDTLTIENDRILRSWLWNNGNPISLRLVDKMNGTEWNLDGKSPDLYLPGEGAAATNGEITCIEVEESPKECAHVEVNVICKINGLQVRKLMKLYPNCPAIKTELYIKGQANQKWVQDFTNAADLQNIEKLTTQSGNGKSPVLEQLYLPGKHWKTEAIEFFDISDRFNTFVRPVSALSYRDCIYRGNLLFAKDMEHKAGIFMLKESPTSNIELAYPGGDFLTNAGHLQMIGIGIDSADIKTDEWTRAYGYVTGVYGNTEKDKLTALRNYQMRIRPTIKERDEMIMLNTWGDRGQDTRVNEAFCLAELDRAAALGITHFQIDDGWQAGRSANSAYGGSFKNIWDNPKYWTPDPQRFPNGLKPIVEKGRKLGIEICLWFNPSSQNDNADWKKDADALISLNKEYGIRTFKIDGTAIPNKLAESRLRKLYDRVMEATNWNAVLNLDATAGRRGGYFFFNEYGNIFLENRYTDWNNYYPYWTLRNLWMLSKYVPAQNLQIEFLNKWRNVEKYSGDTFTPAQYDFEYLFATTMAAQPLAWFEGANLPQEAFNIKDVVNKYKTIQHDFHTGYILPIGDEPSGTSWCGFQSVREERGYFLVFREKNDIETFEMPTYLTEGEPIHLTPILGDGEAFNAYIKKDGRIDFKLPKANSYALYSYYIIKERN